MRQFAALGLALALAACSPAGRSMGDLESAAPAAAPAMEMAVSEAKMAADAPADGGGAGGGAGAPNAAAPTTPMLAYMYNTVLETPAARVVATMKAHEKTCQDAGPALCQVVGSQSSAESDTYVTANLSLRAEPKWLKTFREGLESDAEKAGGRVKSTGVSSEDLTRAIVDTEAQLRAQRTLRDRLQQILRERPGKLAELLETERELARVQGQIDSFESNLAVMRARVAMSTLDLAYGSKPTAVTGGTFQPIADAVTRFVHVVAQGIGAIITLVALLLPWLIVLLPAGWLIRRWWAGHKARKAAASAS